MTISRRDKLRFYARDVRNFFRYGLCAPKSAELIWVCPQDIHTVLKRGVIRHPRWATGKVMAGDWDLHVAPVEKYPKYKVCINRFVYGLDWESSGAFDVMGEAIKGRYVRDGCQNLQDVIRRYQLVDDLYARLQNGGRYKTMPELWGKLAFRECMGVYVHINRRCAPVFGGGGWHRLAIARILQLDVIPAQIGVVHAQAVKTWKSMFKTF